MVDPEISGWNEVPNILSCLIATIVSSSNVDKTSTLDDTLFTIGALIKTALISPLIPLNFKFVSKDLKSYHILLLSLLTAIF